MSMANVDPLEVHGMQLSSAKRASDWLKNAVGLSVPNRSARATGIDNMQKRVGDRPHLHLPTRT